MSPTAHLCMVGCRESTVKSIGNRQRLWDTARSVMDWASVHRETQKAVRVRSHVKSVGWINSSGGIRVCSMWSSRTVSA